MGGGRVRGHQRCFLHSQGKLRKSLGESVSTRSRGGFAGIEHMSVEEYSIPVEELGCVAGSSILRLRKMLDL